LKIQTVNIYSSASFTHINFYFWKTLKSRFLVAFQSFVFGQILANVGSFGQILLHWQWLTACPDLGCNLKNLITFEPWVQILYVVSHWKATIHIYKLNKSSQSKPPRLLRWLLEVTSRFVNRIHKQMVVYGKL
jgi:hypothetical protein